ncbi:hypothetical protein [Phytoactinopolyspora endophytica]|nr:hypothetical protein [Phytoactinopolyspora endophytica]
MVDCSGLELSRWGAVVDNAGHAPWLVVDDVGKVVEPIQRYLV